MKMLRNTLIGVTFLAAISGVPGMGQRQGGGNSTPTQPPPTSRTPYPSVIPMSPMGGMDPSAGPDIMSVRMAEQQAKSRNSERQRRLEADTQKLVGLVNDFKEQMDKGISPAEMSKRAEEIEKLAKSVKDRMKG